MKRNSDTDSGDAGTTEGDSSKNVEYDVTATEVIVEDQEEIAKDVVVKKKRKTTPLPMRQMIPMTFVLLSESLCQTMLLPFVGLLVAHLRGKPKEEAGYVSGVLIGLFMLGQVTSAKTWGWLSDQYGRRFPLISGLFTSGIMILGFGLSNSIWLCALFRFLQGFFNGNILVAKTMMADITDKTNQAQGFAFVSFTYGVGVLGGSLLGGTLYDPTSEESAMHFLHLDPEGPFGRHPALLPSLVIFVYTFVGMTVCTFLVQESNPHAKPFPNALKLLYPCMFVPAKQFEKPLPPDELDETQVKATAETTETSEDPLVADLYVGRSKRRRTFLNEDVRKADDVVIAAEAEDDLPEGTFVSHAPADVTPRQQQQLPLSSVEQTDARSCDRAQVGPGQREARTSHDLREGTIGDTEFVGSQPDSTSRSGSGAIGGSTKDTNHGSTSAPPARGTKTAPEATEFSLGDLMPGYAQVSSPTHGGGTFVMTFRNFGYKQAFSYPPTRFLLLAFMLLSGGCMCFDETFPLWLIASRNVGGLNYTSSQVGYIMMSNSVPTILSNMVFHKVCRRFDDKMQVFRIGVFLTALSFALMPFAAYIAVAWLRVSFVVLCSCMRMFFSAWGYSIVTMLTATAAPKGHVGAIMGINQSVGCLTRGLTPVPAGIIFAWSISEPHIPPFNHFLIFFIAASVLWYDCFLALTRVTNDAGVLHLSEHGAWYQCKQSAVALWRKLPCVTE